MPQRLLPQRRRRTMPRKHPPSRRRRRPPTMPPSPRLRQLQLKLRLHLPRPRRVRAATYVEGWLAVCVYCCRRALMGSWGGNSSKSKTASKPNSRTLSLLLSTPSRLVPTVHKVRKLLVFCVWRERKGCDLTTVDSFRSRRSLRQQSVCPMCRRQVHDVGVRWWHHLRCAAPCQQAGNRKSSLANGLVSGR
jgi:hypothetical protein